MVLSDLGLPDGTGIDMLRRIRQRHPVTAIALSGYGMEDDVRKIGDVRGRSTKSKARSPKRISNLKFKSFKRDAFRLEPCSFEFEVCFVLRA
jgi:CheY-like chemotaxis protein